MNSAWLIHAPQGYGKWPLLQRTANALLCESPQSLAASQGNAGPPQVSLTPTGGGSASRPWGLSEPEAARLPAALSTYKACGHCASCALLAAGTHPDLLIAAPEAMWPELGLNPSEETAPRSETKTASLEIRIEQIRRLNDWSVSTSHRGRAKVALIYPADALNAAAANALLKTLEEPPEDVQFLLGAHRLDALLPTIRSRCRLAALPRPGAAEAQQQLGGKTEAAGAQQAVLAWSQGAVYQANPALGLEWAESLLDALSRQAARPQSSTLPPPPDQAAGVASLLKIGSDLQRVQVGAPPLYLPQKLSALTALAQRIAPLKLADALDGWRQKQRLAGFPLNQALASDALLLEFAQLFSRGD
ncbi:DNA polymerase III subunit delta' [Thiomonas arsenitoxydans]|uniref:DNA polymerase III subunit delta' n=1 Tax=Thiomonas arsenitoxydans (strain DSM 22701 / CIP 110005 / 3As) TaxID=426114 RepID=UPI001AD395F0|nr:DNA polymerase III subunit delta' [Thiomonas arsenitoxydans]MBN8776741.1 DNA polymerase III subunit delta' [Thiomonas arsenitoxydans]